MFFFIGFPASPPFSSLISKTFFLRLFKSQCFEEEEEEGKSLQQKSLLLCACSLFYKNISKISCRIFLYYSCMLITEVKVLCSYVTQSLKRHFETVPNSKKLQMTTEMWLLKDFKIVSIENIVEKVEIAKLSNFTFFHNVFLKLFSSLC